MSGSYGTRNSHILVLYQDSLTTKLQPSLQIIFYNTQSNFSLREQKTILMRKNWLPGKYQVEVTDAYFTDNRYLTSLVTQKGHDFMVH